MSSYVFDFEYILQNFIKLSLMGMVFDSHGEHFSIDPYRSRLTGKIVAAKCSKSKWGLL